MPEPTQFRYFTFLAHLGALDRSINTWFQTKVATIDTEPPFSWNQIYFDSEDFKLLLVGFQAIESHLFANWFPKFLVVTVKALDCYFYFYFLLLTKSVITFQFISEQVLCLDFVVCLAVCLKWSAKDWIYLLTRCYLL